MVIGIDASRLTETDATGTERYSREVTEALLRLAPHHTFWLYARPDRKSIPDALARQYSGVRVISITPRRLWSQVGLAREIGQRPPDALFIPAHVLPWWQAIQRSTHSVVTVHDVGYRNFPHAHPLRQRLYLHFSTAMTARYASGLAVDSIATLNDVNKFYGLSKQKRRVAYPGLIPVGDVDDVTGREILNKYELQAQIPYVLYIGTLQPRKNLRRLGIAWAEILRTWSASALPVLMIAGGQGWGGEDLRAQVASLGIAAHVRFAGYVSEREKAVLMRRARAFAFPSLYEGFGLPVLEAQSVGVPVVCSNSSSLPEVAGDAALLVDPLDTAQIASALRVALTDDDIRARLTDAGLRNVKRFTWERCASVVLELLESKG